MKIHPGLHDIVSSQAINKDTDVQLAYITNESEEPTLTLNANYYTSSRTALIPYETFDKQDILLYDEDDNEITDSYNYITRIDTDKYQYIPQNIAASIQPDTFQYKVIGKKNETYNNTTNYYISVKAFNDKYNSSDQTSLISTLKTIFLDASVRGLCPESIVFNGNDQNDFVYDQTSDDCDFCFIKSNDGINVDGTKIIDEKNFFGKNLWIIVPDNSFPTSSNVMSLYDYDGTDHNFMTSSDIYKTIDYSGLKLFLAQRYKEQVDAEIFTYSDTMYAPLFIKEDRKHNRYIIYSPSSLFEKPTISKINLIIEYILKIYLCSYVYSSKAYPSWIADEMPDYVVNNHKLTKQLKFVSDKPYYDLLDASKSDISYIDTEIIDNTNISCALDASDYIVFSKKQSSSSGVTKPDGYISIYCPNKTIIYYKDNVYMKTTDLNKSIKYSLDLDTLTVIIKDYYDSYHGISLVENTASLIIKHGTNSNVYIAVKDNKLQLITEGKYSTEDGIVLGILYIQYDKTVERQLYDIRLRGGGLPKNKKHDFQSILDIGSIKGMAYRRSGSLIIQIPEEFRQYDNIIKAAIDKHKAADEYAIVLYY